MLSLFIMLFIAIGIAAGIGYAIVTLINTAQISLTVQQNQVRLQNISTAIRAGLTTDDGSVLLPVSAKVDGVYQARLPDSSPFNTTSNGRPIVYCPAFPADGGAETLTNRQEAGDETIAVSLREVGGREYIYGGHADFPVGSDTLARLNKMGVVAYLLSPQPNYDGPLYCSGVRISDQDNYTLLVNGGSAVPIYSVTTDGRGSVFVLSGDGLAPAYNGTDRVVKTMADVGDFMTRYQIADVTVKIPQTFDVEYGELRRFLSSGTAKTIRIVPEDDTARSVLNIIPNAGEQLADTIFVEAMGGLVIDDIDVVSPSSDVVLEAGAVSSITLVDSTVAGLRATGGRISAVGTTRIVPEKDATSGVPPVAALGGNITISSVSEPAVDGSQTTLGGAFLADGGTISLRSGLKIAANPAFPELRQLFSPMNGGRITVPGETPVLAVDRGTGVYETETATFDRIASTRQTLETTCADGSTECEVTCGAGKVVDFGFCSTDNGASVSAFRPVADQNGALTSFSCSFGGVIAAQKPKASAVCDFPK
jgi:hypothetical protein